MILNNAELEELTGSRYKNAQCRILREMGYQFVTRKDGSPVVGSSAVPRNATTANGELLSECEIAKRAKPIAKTCAVYFLLQGSNVVYVGKTINLHKRIGEHLADRSKHFDAYYHIEVLRTKADYVEQAYIRTLKPRFNVQMNG